MPPLFSRVLLAMCGRPASRSLFVRIAPTVPVARGVGFSKNAKCQAQGLTLERVCTHPVVSP